MPQQPKIESVHLAMLEQRAKEHHMKPHQYLEKLIRDDYQKSTK